MITKFTTVYAGHVDLPDRGQNATPANERRYSNEHLASVFEKTEAIAKKMDALGFDTLWLAEHHFQHEGYECIPNDLMLAVHLAHVTKNLKIGCAFNVAPMWHPLRLAEDFATADILTGGRTIFGVGRGYHTREVGSVAELLGGADNICVSTDFPHFDSSFPDVSTRVLSNPSLTPELAAKILYGGARLYGFGEDDFAKADAAAKRRDNQAPRA